jgi:peptide/nickel transport system substrate-binding protein
VLGVAAIAAVVVVAAGSAAKSSHAKSQISKGGTLRVGWEQSFGFTDNLDPTGEYLGDGFGILENMIRPLVGYKHEAGAAGNQPVPDLATSVPKPTNGGKTYTFHLKNVKFGPPVNRQITSADVKYAMERLANPKDGGEYAFYYTVIKGWDAYAAGKAKSISGIQTPNKSTIVFNLTTPTGDFVKRMGMPATAPIPQEVAKCFNGQPGKYAQDLISSGPYMIQGIDQVNASSCSTLKPVSGYDPNTHLFLVRNPNYVQSTDPYRHNYPDQIQFTIDSSNVDIYNKIEANQLDLATSSIPPQVLRQYSTSPSLKSHYFVNSGDRTWYLTMNLTQPPFDDIHVRKAFNYIIDKKALVQAWGGPTVGSIATHIVPNGILNNVLSEYDPYKTPGEDGSVAKAKAAMKGSKYDTAGNGTCSAPQCHGILMIADTRSQDPKMVAVIEQDARKIGMSFTVRTINGAYPTIQTVAKNVPIAERPGWGKDYADALTFFTPLFDGRNIIPTGNTNYSLVGITQKQCDTLKVKGDCAAFNSKTGLGVPSINSQLDKCAALVGGPRNTCYAALDKTLMTKVVPWVPYLWSYVTRITSNNVTHYQFDQFATTPAYSEISVK